MKSKSASAPLALTVFAVALALVGCRDAQTYLKRGDSYFSQGKFAEATLNYRKAIQKEPSLGEGYFKSGLSELKENKAAEALADLQKAVQLMPDNAAAKTELTNLLLSVYIGDQRHPKFVYDLMVRYSDEWLKRNPQSKQGLRIKGYVAMLERRPEEAVVLFRRALQNNPEDEQMALSLMGALFRDNQPAAAEKAGLDFIDRHSSAGDVYDALFRLYSTTNRASDAVHILERKASSNPKQGDYMLQLARYYALVHNQSGVQQAMRTFLANPGGDPALHLKAGDAYAAMGNFTTALEQYYAGLSEAAQKKNQADCVKYQKRIARADLSLGRKSDALRALDTALSHDPGDREAQALRAGLLVANGKSGGSGEGVKKFQELVEKNPDDIVLRYALAKSLLETGDLAAARAQLQQVVTRNPAFLDAQLDLGDVAFRQGNFTEAANAAQAALESDPGNARAQLLQGKSLMRTGNLDQAANVLGKLLKQN